MNEPIHVLRLVWDEWNIVHIARHSVTPEEVEEVCGGKLIVREGYGHRLILVGPTGAGRLLVAGAHYPVIAYPASRKMRRIYQDETAGEVE